MALRMEFSTEGSGGMDSRLGGSLRSNVTSMSTPLGEGVGVGAL